MTEWPNWWDRELELRSHLLKRVLDRDFSEVDLRSMDQAVGLHADIEPGRWVKPVALAANLDFSARELRRIERLVAQHEDEIIEAWNEHFRD